MSAFRFFRRRSARNVLLASAFALVLTTVTAPPSRAAAVPGSAGQDISLPVTDSQVTVSGRGAFSNMKFTVNQTKNLVNQAVSVKWTGGAQTIGSPQTYSGNVVQIMQCWGDDDGTVPENPGPAPEQCQWGGLASQYDNSALSLLYPYGFLISRIASVRGWPNESTSGGYLDPATGFIWRSFRAVDGTVVNSHFDSRFNPEIVGGNYWLNPYFNAYTTNEVANGKTGADGTGQSLFEVQTGLEAPGLGCAQRIVMSGGTKTPKCWMVIVPRSTPTVENLGTPFETNAEQVGVVTSPVSTSAWKHRISIPLDFNSLDTACSIGAADRRIVGSELSLLAVTSWQSSLCQTAGLPPYTFGVVPDASARQQIVRPTTGSAGMAVTSAPIAASDADPTSPVVYAPVAASAVVIGFNVERTPTLASPDAEKLLQGTPVANINLTPRLVAKLLTQSYRFQVQSFTTVSYTWLNANPSDLSTDPDFQQFNPEFALLRTQNSKNFGGLVLPSRTSDANRLLWQWVLADPEAKAWLDGTADKWGMKVNPVYATTAAANSTGVAFAADGAPDSFPKSEPYCYQAPTLAGNPPVVPNVLCGTDLLPYSQGLRDAARATRVADDGAKTSPNNFAISSDQFWKRTGPQLAGTRSILSITDAPSAARYGVQTARLSRAGDDSASRTFIAADTAGLTAGIAAMAPKSERAVREVDPSVNAPAAYPLTTLTYAAVKPLALDAASRNEYAAFIDYAAGNGQVAGLEPGRLPQGYAPLPTALRTQATDAARTIRSLQPAASGAASEIDQTSFSSTIDDRPTAAQVVTTVAPVAATPPVERPKSTKTDTPLALTPIVAVARNRFVIPILGGLALLGALMALEISRRPRRARPSNGAGG